MYNKVTVGSLKWSLCEPEDYTRYFKVRSGAHHLLKKNTHSIYDTVTNKIPVYQWKDVLSLLSSHVLNEQKRSQEIVWSFPSKNLLQKQVWGTSNAPSVFEEKCENVKCRLPQVTCPLSSTTTLPRCKLDCQNTIHRTKWSCNAATVVTQKETVSKTVCVSRGGQPISLIANSSWACQPAFTSLASAAA